MEDTENNQEQHEEPIDMSTVSPIFRAYVEAKEAFLAKYANTKFIV